MVFLRCVCVSNTDWIYFNVSFVAAANCTCILLSVFNSKRRKKKLPLTIKDGEDREVISHVGGAEAGRERPGFGCRAAAGDVSVRSYLLSPSFPSLSTVTLLTFSGIQP